MPRFVYSKNMKKVLKEMDHQRKGVSLVSHSSVANESPDSPIRVKFTTSGLTICNSWTIAEINKMARIGKI